LDRRWTTPHASPTGSYPPDFEHPERYFISDEYKRLKRFEDRLDRVIVSVPEYRRIPLPRRKVGYPY
jgi:hypothetical protein